MVNSHGLQILISRQ